MFGNMDELPLPSPIVTFTGPILGPGTELLQDDNLISGIDESQRKCCGFVQLSTYITPGTRRNPIQGLPPIPGIRHLPTACQSMDIPMRKDGCKAQYAIPTERVVQLHGKSSRVA
jgi:hypothetical protein